MLPVRASHMETVLSLQTREIVLCCCFSPQAQPSIRRIKLPTLDSTELAFFFFLTNAIYKFWKVFEKQLFYKEVYMLQKHAGASSSSSNISSEKTILHRLVILWHKPL